MTSAAAMISGNGGGGGGGGTGEGDTAIRPSLKDSRTSLVPTPDAGSVGRSSTRSPSALSYSSTSPALPMAGMMMHEPERIRMRGTVAGSNRRRVKDFNDSITCTLCNGYLVEATSVNDCLHSFCRSCIVKYLECNKYCPRCKSYNSKPITVTNLRPDRTLSALVYKLVPGLHKAENQRIVQFYASISSSIVPSEEDTDPATGQGTFQLLDDQNFFSPDEPISLSLEYHYETLAELSRSSAPLPITYLQCPAAVTVHHLYKFILTKNGLQVGADNIRVDIIYEEEILPHDFTLMDVAYCYDYKRIAPMRFFYRILIHSTAKLAATASAYHRVEGQDKNSTNSSNSGTSPNTSKPGSKSSATSSSSSSSTPTVKTTPVTDGQRPNSTKTKAGQGQGTGGGKPTQPCRAPREDAANNSAPMAAVNGHHHRTKSSTAKMTPATTSSEVNRSATKTSAPVAVTSSASSGLKVVLVPPKAKPEPSAADAKRSPPPLKAIQAAAAAVNGGATAKQSDLKSKEPQISKGKEETASNLEGEKSSPNSTLKCYVNLKTQTVVGPPATENAHQKPAAESESRKQSQAEIPRLKIDLKAKLSIPREKNPNLSPPSSSSSSAATSPSSATSATSSTGKSPVWPMGKEEYAKTIGLKPVYASTVPEVPEANESGSHSSSHRKRKKGKHSKEAGSSGKRRKLHAEISSQHDESLKMKVKLTEKPPKHERLKSSGNEEEVVQPKSPPAPAVVPEPVPSPPKPSKVIDITKDDDEVKFVNEQKLTQVKSSPPVTPKELPLSVPVPASSASSKEKLNEMRSVRHKPMVYIPNLDRSLSADSASSGSSINSLLESVGAKTSLLKPTPALIPTSTAASGMAGKSQPRAAILSRPMPSCPPLAYPIASSPVTSSTTGSIRTMAAPPAIKRSISTDSNGNGSAAKVPRLEPPALMPPVSLLPAKHPAPIQAPMFNFAKGANRAKAAQQAAGMAPTQPDHIPYRSPISASYTKEIPSTKKPLPGLLLPPATVSVTKMTEIATSATLSPSPVHENSRPAVEFLRISANAPVADKPTLAPFTTPKMNTKTTRPPPATIPLIKIKNPAGTNGNETMQSPGTPPSMTPLSPHMRPKGPVRSSSDPTTGSNAKILDLSGSGGSGGRRLSDDVIILDHSPAKSSRIVDSNRAKPAPAGNFSSVKRTPDMMSFSPPTSTTTLLSQGVSPVQKTLAPLPKLTEINRHRSLTVRQPNASIRSIPNPSALAFRGSQTSVATTVSSSSHTSSTAGMLKVGFSSSPSQHAVGSNRTNGNTSGASMTSSSTSVKPSVSLSNGSAAARSMMGISSGGSGAAVKSSNGSGEQKPPAPHNGANGNTFHSSNNNNNSKVANANAGFGPAKKTIEKVAAVLKAAAATADTTSSQRSTSTTATTSTTASHGASALCTRFDVERRAIPQKEDKPTAQPDSTIVTSVTTASITSVTGTNGSSRTSPASMVHVE
ncbi:protein suppressor 2 of zeste [Anopheles maculipalpis]|uniref:protein suppressor 2 of zeste n=1 Tax=Anopheles maculipalpis TaxID=1496333 RepID=UPI0021596502|nr:protein suppressor 2 of zeste [Anopheles maculipalpis]